jgi:hypothetical protein
MSANINDPSQKQTCEKCGQQEDNLYAFHFGKKKSETSRHVGNKTIYTTNYDIGGRIEAAACNKCIQRRWAFRLVVFGLMFIAGAGAALWAYKLNTFKGPLGISQMAQLQVFVGGGGGILGLIGLYGLLLNLFAGKVTHAENLIIAIKKPEVRKLGFNTFWNTKNFKKLKRMG